jgi:hypothetical protein
MDKPLRIKQRQHNDILKLKEKHKLVYNWQVLDLLLKNQKYVQDLENRVKHVHMLTKI